MSLFVWRNHHDEPCGDAEPRRRTGRIYLIQLGMKGPGSVERHGGYEDVYVKTPQGWRFKQRTHFALLSGGRPATPPPAK